MTVGVSLDHSRPQSLATLEASRDDYARASKADSTLRSYKTGWAAFERWCAAMAVFPLPSTPATITLYLSQLADGGAKVSTIKSRLAAISVAHQVAGFDPPPTRDKKVRLTMEGIRRSLGVSASQKAPLSLADLRHVLNAIPLDTLAGARDRALLLLGLPGGFRRSELVALDVEDVTESEHGLSITIRRSKTDQEGEGRMIGIVRGQKPDTCPVLALRGWREVSGIEDGPLFRSINRHDQMQPSRLTPQSVALIVKRAVARAGLDPRRYAGHSLRSGLATSAAVGGAPERAIMRQTGHRSEAMVRRYIRPATIWTDNASAFLGL